MPIQRTQGKRRPLVPRIWSWAPTTYRSTMSYRRAFRRLLVQHRPETRPADFFPALALPSSRELAELRPLSRANSASFSGYGKRLPTTPSPPMPAWLGSFETSTWRSSQRQSAVGVSDRGRPRSWHPPRSRWQAAAGCTTSVLSPATQRRCSTLRGCPMRAEQTCCARTSWQPRKPKLALVTPWPSSTADWASRPETGRDAFSQARSRLLAQPVRRDDEGASVGPRARC